MGIASPPSSLMRPGAFPPRPGRRLLRYLVPTCLLLACFYYLSGYSSSSSGGHYVRQPSFRLPSDLSLEQILDRVRTPSRPHPIDALIEVAEQQFSDLLAKESHSLDDAAAAYRQRRGRHPPPGFDEWYQFARARGAVVVEDFWDPIYHDLEPFWALPAARIRKEAWDFEMTISVRNHNASAVSNWFWTQIWLEMIQTVEHLLPDMDIALNAMDEPRMVVPWEDMVRYMKKAARTRGMRDPAKVVSEFRKLDPPGEGDDRSEVIRDKDWEDTIPYWLVARRGCAPHSLARRADPMINFNVTPTIANELASPHMYRGFVANYTLSTEICHQPDLQGLNGIFVEPLTVSATKTLFPMFGGSKLAVNNEILLPAPMYWSQEERFTGGGEEGVPWAQKRDQVIWRGVATGGRNREATWRAFQRHRFVAMNNATKLARAEDGTELPANFALPPAAYGLRAMQGPQQELGPGLGPGLGPEPGPELGQKPKLKPVKGQAHALAQRKIQEAKRPGRLGEWVGQWANVSFVDLMCYPSSEDSKCNYTSPHFAVTKGVKMAEQFDHKYLPDIDGNSFSGRYLGFLRSTSLPIKATVWREWHDSRLVAWKHFVPMDNRYSDWYAIMEYFLGYDPDSSEESSGGDGQEPRRPSSPAHDAAAAAIASAGKEWADRVLRREDMQIYVLRLLLEYARVCDERRESMGWVDDLLGK